MDKQRIAEFADTVYRDMAGAMTIGMAYVGQRTGLFAALAKAGAVTPAALAEVTPLGTVYYAFSLFHCMTQSRARRGARRAARGGAAPPRPPPPPPPTPPGAPPPRARPPRRGRSRRSPRAGSCRGSRSRSRSSSPPPPTRRPTA
jgi:hypothetical protein